MCALHDSLKGIWVCAWIVWKFQTKQAWCVVQISFGYFKLVQNFERFKLRLTRVCELCMKLIGWSKWCFVVTMWCNITPSRASHDAKRRFCYGRSMFHKLINGTIKFEFLHEFSVNFKRNWQGMVQTSFGMWLCMLVPNLRSFEQC